MKNRKEPQHSHNTRLYSRSTADAAVPVSEPINGSLSRSTADAAVPVSEPINGSLSRSTADAAVPVSEPVNGSLSVDHGRQTQSDTFATTFPIDDPESMYSMASGISSRPLNSLLSSRTLSLFRV